MKTFSEWTILSIVASFLLSGIGDVYGQSKFPQKPITLVVHAAAGGGSDIFARTLSAGIEKE